MPVSPAVPCVVQLGVAPHTFRECRSFLDRGVDTHMNNSWNKALLLLAVLLIRGLAVSQDSAIKPGARSLMDAHNCYPYYEWWNDRIDRALSAGTPLAIEQDLAWHTDKRTGKSWSVLTHGGSPAGNEPTMQQYFFERIRPIVEQAMR